MTTIAYRNGILAADGRITMGDTIFTDTMKKIVRLSDGALFALCGDFAWFKPLLDAIEDDDLDLPEAKDDFTAVVMEKDGTVRTYDGKGSFLSVGAPYYAFGSGADFAIGAMDMGASAEQAVRIACGRDLGTGGVIQVEKPGHVQPARRKKPTIKPKDTK